MKTNRICSIMRALGALAVLVMALGLPCPAAAEVRGTDIVLGQTADARGIAQEDMPDIAAPHAIMVDADGTVLYERGADDQVKIASITKVMTALVALDHAELTDTVTVDHAAATVGESTSNLKEGDTLSVEDALRALLIPSGNDAAMAIATSVGALIDPASSDPYQTFIDAMNEKAAELGMENSVFENPHGLDFDEWAGSMHSTARDVATMVAAAMHNDTFRAIVGQGDADITVTAADGTPKTLHLRDVNQLVGIEGNIGVKTGLTDDAGSCFAGAFSRNQGEIYTVVLGCAEPSEETEKTTQEPRFVDTLALVAWYSEHMVTADAVTSDVCDTEGRAIAGRATLADWSDKTVTVVAADPSQQVAYFDLGDPIEVDVALDTLSGDVRAGDAAGTLTLSQDDHTLATVDLIAAENVAAPSIFERILVGFDRMVRFFTGEPGEAPAEVLATAPATSATS